jgi:putative transposase
MKRKRFTEEQIVGILKESEAGAKTKELCRQARDLRRDVLQLEAKCAGMTVSEARRLRELEHENAKLKKLLAEAELDKAALKDLLGRKMVSGVEHRGFGLIEGSRAGPSFWRHGSGPYVARRSMSPERTRAPRSAPLTTASTKNAAPFTSSAEPAS